MILSLGNLAVAQYILLQNESFHEIHISASNKETTGLSKKKCTLVYLIPDVKFTKKLKIHIFGSEIG